MRRWARAVGWGWVILTVITAAVVVTVGAFRARHNMANLGVWVEWATIVAVPVAALGGLPALLDKITGNGTPHEVRVGDVRAWRVVPVPACSPHDVRVHMAAEPTDALPLYVKRDHDDLLRARLRSASLHGGFVLVTGGSAAGKSRSLLEAVCEVLREWQILFPVSSGAVRDAAAGGHIRPHTVVWLDDTPVEKYITATPDGLSSDDIRAVLSGRGPVMIVDFIWQRRYQALIAQPRLPPGMLDYKDPSREARDALLLAGEPIQVKDDFSDSELVRARVLASRDQRLADALADTRFGVTQSLAGARALVYRYRDAESDMPFAFAVMTAAIDACRLGHRGPFTQDFLRAAAFGYLSSRDQAAAADGHPGSRPDWFSEALAYAADTDANPGHVAPLVPSLLAGTLAHGVGYFVADYLLQYMLRERRRIQVPTPTWEALLTYTDVPIDLARLLFEQGRMDELRLRADAGDVQAQELLTDWLVQEGQIPELRQRADAGDDNARRLLAEWLSQQDRVDDAIEAIRPLADVGDDNARRLLAEWLSQQDRVDDAIEAIRPLADVGDDNARRLLAGWLLEAGRIDELGYRADAGDGAARSMLARWLYDQGRVDDAIAAIRPLADADDAAARRLLADWLSQHGRIEQLRQRAARNDDDPARSRLARWLLEHGQIDELRQRAASGDDHAELLLADWSFEQRGTDELRQRVENGDAGARFRLARLLYEKDSVEEAIAAIRPLADAGDSSALQWLADRLYERDAVDELRERADGGDEHAEGHLVSWLLNHRQENELRQRFSRADYAARARLTLRMAIWMYEQDRADEAIATIRPLAAVGNEAANQILSVWSPDYGRDKLTAMKATGLPSDGTTGDLQWPFQDTPHSVGRWDERSERYE